MQNQLTEHQLLEISNANDAINRRLETLEKLILDVDNKRTRLLIALELDCIETNQKTIKSILEPVISQIMLII